MSFAAARASARRRWPSCRKEEGAGVISRCESIDVMIFHNRFSYMDEWFPLTHWNEIGGDPLVPVSNPIMDWHFKRLFSVASPQRNSQNALWPTPAAALSRLALTPRCHTHSAASRCTLPPLGRAASLALFIYQS